MEIITDISRLGYYQLLILSETFRVLAEHKFPEEFNSDSKVSWGYNNHSNKVFLFNEEGQCLLLDENEELIIYEDTDGE